uniref:C-type lectin domain-containing protein n=1 Tax=Knipowitschia caucasica TaxID=637954 RepID=A0AAV2LJ78_KNICA
MKTAEIFLLFAAVALRATAAPAEEAPVQKPEPEVMEVNQEPKPEVAEALVPLGAEVHSQYCLPGWEFYRGSCYFLNRNSYTWSGAVSYCANFRATVASVHSPLEYNHFQYMIGRAGLSTAWIGGYHFEYNWRWHDGSVFDYQNFMSGGSSSTNKCLRMNTLVGQGWYSSHCNNAIPSICQVKVHC